MKAFTSYSLQNGQEDAGGVGVGELSVMQINSLKDEQEKKSHV